MTLRNSFTYYTVTVLMLFALKTAESQEIVSSYHTDSLLLQLSQPDNQSLYPEKFETDPCFTRLYKENGPYNIVKQEDEILENRTLYSKEYYARDKEGNLLKDQRTTILSSGEIHYQENGMFKTITEDILPNSTTKNREYQLIAPNNKFKTYYGKENEMSVKMCLKSGNTIHFMNNTGFQFLDDTYLPVSEKEKFSAPSVKQADYQTILYDDIYGDKISAWVKQQMTGFKSSYVIHSDEIFSSLPDHAKYISFIEEVILPSEKWTAHHEFDPETNQIIIYNNSNEIIGYYEAPYIFDNTGFANGFFSDYRISQSGNVLTIEIMVPLEWLTSDERAFPVTVDPTWYAGTGSDWTGTVYRNSDGDKGCTSSDYIRLGFEDVTWPSPNKWYSGWATFSMSSFSNPCGIQNHYMRAYRYSANGGSISYYTGSFNSQALHPTHRSCSNRYDNIDYPTNRTHYDNTPASGWNTYAVNLNDILSRIGNTYTAAFWTDHNEDPSGGTGDESQSAYFRGRSSSYRPQLIINTYASPNAGSMSVTNSTICTGGSTSFQAGGTSYFEQLQCQWDGTGGTWSNWGSSNPHTWSSSNTGHRLYVRSKASNGSCTNYSSAVSCLIVADPSISISANRTSACVGGNISLSASYSGGTGSFTFQWQYYNGSSWINVGSNSTSYTVPTSSTFSGREYRCILNCSGSDCNQAISNTVSLSVVSDPTAPVVSKSPDVPSVCTGALLSGTASGGSGGTGTISYDYQYQNANSSSYAGGSSFTSAGTGTAYIRARRTASGNGCDDSPWTTVNWIVNADPVSGTVTRFSPLTENICIGDDITVQINGASGGTGCSDEIQYKIGPAGAIQTYSGTFTSAVSGEYYFRTRRACTGEGCDTPAWSSWIMLYRVNDNGKWIGVDDSNWHNTNNWCGTVPTSTSDAIIVSVADNMPVISNSDAQIRTLTVENGSSLSISGNKDLEFWGNFTNLGTLNMSTGSESLVFKGTGNQISNNGAIINNLIVDGTSASLLVLSNLNIDGDLQILQGTLVIGSHTINIAGDIDVSGSISAPGSTVVLDGNSTQTINMNGSSSVLNNLTVNNTSGNFSAITLASDLYLNGNLDMQAGIIDNSISGYIVKILNGGDSNPGNANSFIRGEIERTGSTVYVFPTGDVANVNGTDRSIWAPVGIDACASSTISANYYYENPPYDWWFHSNNMDPTIDHVTDREYWELSSNNAYPAVTLYWTDNTSDLHSFGSTSGEMTDEFINQNLTVAHYNINTNRWEDMGSSTTGTAYFNNGHLKTIAAFPGYSPISFASKLPSFTLPVELTNFDIICNGTSVSIIWNTASEVNNDYFTIEGSKDGFSWNTIEYIQGAGNTNLPQEYSVHYEYPEFSFYRLTQYDFDGKNDILGIKEADCSEAEKTEIICYPNPFNTELNILISNSNEQYLNLKLYDVSGRKIGEESLEINRRSIHKIIDTHSLSPGMYYLLLTGEHTEEHLKLEKSE